MKVFSVILVGVFVFVFVSGCWAGDSWEQEFKDLQQWRDKNQLAFSDKELEDVAKNHPRPDKWVEIQEKKHGVSGVRKVLKNAVPAAPKGRRLEVTLPDGEKLLVIAPNGKGGVLWFKNGGKLEIFERTAVLTHPSGFSEESEIDESVTFSLSPPFSPPK